MKPVFAAACLALSLYLSAAPHAAAQHPATDKQQIEAIVDTFRTALINKDKERFMALFLRDDITWSGVFTDASVERVYASRKDPAAARPPKHFISNPRKFIDSIAKNSARLEETFDNVRIDSDGEVAQVWFDYAFLEDGYKTNWGKESWQMVRTAGGWKIAAVVWSMEENPVPPPTKTAR